MSDPKRTPTAHYEPFASLGDLQEDLGMFEAAAHAPSVDLPDVTPKTILLATDSSNQDTTARAVARAVAAVAGAQVVEAAGLKSASDLQAARQQHAADLLVLPVPFGADIGELREESLGDIIDRILLTCLPILAVRQPQDEATLQAAMANVVVPLSSESARAAAALAWACRLLNGTGTLTVVEIADAPLRAEAHQLRDEAEPAAATAAERVNRVLTRHFAGPVAAVQKKAAESGLAVQVTTATGRFVDATLKQLESRPGLVVVAGSTDRRSDTYHHEADLILGSRYPVLVV